MYRGLAFLKLNINISLALYFYLLARDILCITNPYLKGGWVIEIKKLS